MLADDRNKKEKVKRKVGFAENVKMPTVASTSCTIDGDTFYLFMKNMCIGDCGVSYHTMNNYTGFFDIIDINESIQGSFRNMAAMKKGKLCVNIQQVEGAEQVHSLWHEKFCPKAGANLFFLMCEILQGNKTSSDHQNNIEVKSSDGDIILDCQIWIARVKF